MKIIKKIFLTILALIAILLIVAIFVPKESTAQSEIIINKPQQEVFDYIKYVKNQDNFGKWQLMDPTLKSNLEGTDGTVGFKYSWDGEKLGKGSQTITKVDEGKGIETELEFGFGEPSQSFLYTADAGNNQTKVVWGMHGKSAYPFNLMSLFYNMDNDFKEGLENLKRILETK